MHPFIILRGRNKMTKWMLDLFKSKPNKNDIVRFIRTEYSNEVKHLHDIDVLAYYDNIMTKRRT